jgi:hypothetical protein
MDKSHMKHEANKGKDNDHIKKVNMQEIPAKEG